MWVECVHRPAAVLLSACTKHASLALTTLPSFSSFIADIIGTVAWLWWVVTLVMHTSHSCFPGRLGCASARVTSKVVYGSRVEHLVESVLLIIPPNIPFLIKILMAHSNLASMGMKWTYSRMSVVPKNWTVSFLIRDGFSRNFFTGYIRPPSGDFINISKKYITTMYMYKITNKIRL